MLQSRTCLMLASTTVRLSRDLVSEKPQQTRWVSLLRRSPRPPRRPLPSNSGGDADRPDMAGSCLSGLGRKAATQYSGGVLRQRLRVRHFARQRACSRLFNVWRGHT